MGDFQTSLYPQIFNLHTIAKLSSPLDPQQVALSRLEMATWQSLNDLVTAIPGLSNFPVSQVEPVAQLLSKSGLNASASGSIGAVLSEFPQFGEIELGALGDQLNNFGDHRHPRTRKHPASESEGLGQQHSSRRTGII